MSNLKDIRERQKIDRVGMEAYNNNGELMKIIEYNSSSDVLIEFQDEYRYQVRTQYTNFTHGNIKNLFAKSILGVGITGNKYPTRINGIKEKEYDTWLKMLRRCYSEKDKAKRPTYKDVTCCEEWLYYLNFYEWLHSQENFDQWYKGER